MMTDQKDDVAIEDMGDEERKQFEELMAKADDVISEDGSVTESEEPSLVFDNADGLEFVPNPAAIGDGISPEELEAAGLTPEMIKRFIRSRRIMTREKQPCKRYVKRATRVKARKNQRKARKASRG